MISSLLGILVVLVLFGLLLSAVVVRLGAVCHVRLAAAQRGIGPVVVLGGLLIMLTVIALTAALGTPNLERYRLTTYELGLASLVAGVVLVGFAIGRYDEYRLLNLVTATTAGDCRRGDVVALTGTVTEDESECTTTPYEGTPCVAYDARTETGLHSYQVLPTIWLVNDRRTDRQQFQIDDETGSVTVDPRDARLDLPVTASSDATAPVSILRRLLDGTADDSARTDASSRYTERCLEPGDTVGVVGHAVDGDAPTSGPTVEARAVFRVPNYDGQLQRTVLRNGLIGVTLFVAGLSVAVLTAGVV